MTFEAIPIRMLQLSVNREWLAKVCDYTPDSLRQILAPNGKGKTNKALRRIWEALDREEARQKSAVMLPAPLGHRVFIEPTEDQFNSWMQAVYQQPGRTFDAWAKTGLDTLAQEELAQLKPAEGKAPLHALPPAPAAEISRHA